MWYNYSMKIKFVKLLTIVLSFVILCASLTACTKKQFEGISLNDVTVTYSQSGHNVTIVGAENYPNATFTLSEEQINVGTYTQTLVVSQSGYEDFTATATLTITKAVPSSLLPQYDGVSNFADNKLSVIRTGNPINVTIFTNYEQRPYATIEYYQGEVKLDSAPIEAGVYKIKLYVPEIDNYYSLQKEYTLEILEPYYTATYKILNPITNELENAYSDSECVAQYERNSSLIIPSDIVTNKFDGYAFIGWYVEDEPISSIYNYNKNVTIIAKYEQI